jgi:hypothetical protein
MVSPAAPKRGILDGAGASLNDGRKVLAAEEEPSGEADPGTHDCPAAFDDEARVERAATVGACSVCTAAGAVVDPVEKPGADPVTVT